MSECKNVTMDEMKLIMQQAKYLFDIVRLVNPTNTQVIMLDGDNIVTMEKEPCFGIWEKSQSCSNCISLKACAAKSKMTKFEFRNDDIYSVLSIPFNIKTPSSENIYALELVNKVTNNIFLHSYGRGKIIDEVAEINHKIYEDSLTGVFNRRYFDEGMYIYDTMNTIPHKIGFIAIDVKKFKQINDNNGHIIGDNVLKSIADTLKSNMKMSDCVIRMGGDEFLVILRGNSEQYVIDMAQTFKEKVKATLLPDSDINMEINTGISYCDNFNGSEKQIAKMYNLADSRMYTDKNSEE